MAFHLFLLFSLSLLCLSSASAITTDHNILGLDLEKFTTQKQVSALFQLWKKEHGRVYHNQQEEAKRLEIFQRNLNYVRDNNAKRKSPHSHRLGLNKFADLSPDEFGQKYLQDPKEVSPPINLGNMELKKDYPSCDAPASWDWSKKGVVTEVKYQAQCGSGWAFSATGAIEAIHAISTGNLVSLSEQELIDCVNKSRGCYNGWHFHSYEWVIENGGIATEADYPYTGKDGICKANKIQSKVTIDGYRDLIFSDDKTASEVENALLCATFEQPISVAMDAKDFHFYTSGIYDGANCSSPYKINHFVLIVGYDSVDGEDYWIAKNSWGQDWGINGYIWIKRNTGNPLGVCAMNFLASYPTKDNSATIVSSGVKADTKTKKGLIKEWITPLFEV